MRRTHYLQKSWLLTTVTLVGRSGMAWRQADQKEEAERVACMKVD